MPVSRWPMSLIFWWISTNWFVSRKGFSWREQTPYLMTIDIMRTRRDPGIFNRNCSGATASFLLLMPAICHHFAAC